jgi:hypothetical protein
MSKTTANPAPTPTEIPPEVQAVPAAMQEIRDAEPIIAKARALVVSTPEQYVVAADVLQELRGVFRRLEAQRKGITDPMRASIDRVMALFKPKTDAAEEAGNIVRQKLAAYDAEQQRIAEEERRRVEAEARRVREAAEAEARRVREAAELVARQQREQAEREERERQEQERRRREAAEAEARARREAEEAQRRGDEEAARAARQREEAATSERRQAEQAERDAQSERERLAAAATRVETRAETKAEPLQEVATTTVAPVITAPAKVAGITRRMVWKYEIVDPAKVARTFLILDEPKIGKTVRAMGKDAEGTIGGIRVWQEADVAARAK